MRIHITALTNDNARLIASETTTTDTDLAAMIADALKDRGFVVVIRTED